MSPSTVPSRAQAPGLGVLAACIKIAALCTVIAVAVTVRSRLTGVPAVRARALTSPAEELEIPNPRWTRPDLTPLAIWHGAPASLDRAVLARLLLRLTHPSFHAESLEISDIVLGGWHGEHPRVRESLATWEPVLRFAEIAPGHGLESMPPLLNPREWTISALASDMIDSLLLVRARLSESEGDLRDAVQWCGRAISFAAMYCDRHLPPESHFLALTGITDALIVLESVMSNPAFSPELAREVEETLLRLGDRVSGLTLLLTPSGDSRHRPDEVLPDVLPRRVRLMIAHFHLCRALGALWLGDEEALGRTPDPFGDGPLRRSGPMLYSLGPDRIDQRGEMICDPRDRGEAVGDIAVRLPERLAARRIDAE